MLGFAPQKTLAALCLGALLSTPAAAGEPDGVQTQERVRALLARQPVTFEPNRGQAASGVAYVGRTRDSLVTLSGRGLLVRRRARGADVLGVRFVGASEHVESSTRDPLSTRAHYLLGNDPSAWVRDVPTHGGVDFHDVYPGVDIAFRGDGGHLRFDFVLAPGADPDVIRLAFRGARRVSLADDGTVELATAHSVTRLEAPLVFQGEGAARTQVPGRFRLATGGVIGFSVGPYDVSRPLVIDPTVTYSSYVGASQDDQCNAISISPAGDVFVAGTTFSADFPTLFGSAQKDKGDAGTTLSDGFVMKFTPTLSIARSVTYIGGGSDDSCLDVAAGPDGTVYVAGDTDSDDFPLVNAHTGSKTGVRAFLAKIAAGGGSFTFSTYAPSGSGGGLAVDASGNAYHAVSAGGAAVVRKYPADGSAVLYSTTVGSGTATEPRAVAVDGSQRAHVVGETGSSSFPDTAGAFDTSFGGGGTDGFAFQLDSSGTVNWAAFVGGGGADACNDLALGPGGDVWITGGTASSSGFPLDAAEHGALGGDMDAFLMRIESDGSDTVFSTYHGGTDEDRGHGVVVDDCGDAFMVGVTESTDFPEEDATQADLAGGFDAFIARYDGSGSQLYSTWHGGSADEAAFGVALGDGGRAFFVGLAAGSGLPISGSAFRSTNQGGDDGFLAAIQDSNTSFLVTTTSLPSWTAGLAYSAQFASTGGTAPFTWSVASGSPPAGTTLSAGGLLDGTLTAPGTYPLRVKVTDACGRFAVKDFTVFINAEPRFLTGGFPAWTVDVAYDQTFVMAGGTAPLSFGLTDEATLPPGTAFTADGRLHGTLDTVGAFTFEVTATDTLGASVTESFTVTVNPRPAVSATTVPACTEGRPHSASFAGTGGTPPFTWTLASGALPAAAFIEGNGAAASFSGFAKPQGDYTFTLRMTDAMGVTADREFTGKTNPPPQVITTALPMAARARPFVSGVRSAGGTPPVVWQVREGSIPAGLSLDAATGDITGSPASNGELDVKLVLTDACGATDTADYTMHIASVFFTNAKKTRVEIAFGEGLAPEQRRFLDLVARTKITISAKLKGKGSLPLVLELFDNEGVPIDTAAHLKASKKKVQLKNVVVPETGRYFVALRATEPFEGTVLFDVKAKAAGKFTGEAEVGDLVGNPVITADNLPGATFSVIVKRKQGWFATPLLSAIHDGTDPIEKVFGKERTSARRTSFTYRLPLEQTTLSITLDNQPGTEGLVVWTLKLKSPKFYEFSLPELVTGSVLDPE